MNPPAPSRSNALDRRSVLRASAWSGPVIAVVIATPAAAASQPPTDPNTTYYPSNDAFPAYSSTGSSAPVTIGYSYSSQNNGLGFDGVFTVTTASTTPQSYAFTVDMKLAPFYGMDGTKVRISNATTSYDPASGLLTVTPAYVWNSTIAAGGQWNFDFHVSGSDVPMPPPAAGATTTTITDVNNGQWWHSATLNIAVANPGYPFAPDNVPVTWSTTIDLAQLFPGATGWHGQTPQFSSAASATLISPGVYRLTGAQYATLVSPSNPQHIGSFVSFGA
ncbi:hypothetical protein HQQ81_11430 [Microbacteriaceae bacterium VKM Ac-2854]|nr:hypothetical protein [Microbacteriaceae bacterium VKM Ac-2854]